MTPEKHSPGRGIVAAPQSEAAYEGARVLDDGGNAADAVVAAALVQGVVDPHRCGIGGFGCATVLFRGSPALAVDFHGRAGGRARADQWSGLLESAAPDGFGYVLRGRVNDVGYQAIGVPAMLAGVAEIHARFGTLPWPDLVERAVPYAEDGFVVTPELAEFWIRPGLFGRVSTRDRLALTAPGRAICFHENGETFRAGEVFRQAELAATYRRLAQEGPESFYRGELAREIAADWEANAALVTAGDLAACRPRVGEPLAGAYRDREVLTTPLPGGGVALLQALGLIERRDITRLDHNSPEMIHETARILQAVWRDRLANQGDPGFGTPPAGSFLTDAYLDGLLEDPGGMPPVAAKPSESRDTTQLSIIDGWGNAVSFSHSLGYNSGIFAPGLGILYNNCMSAFDPTAGKPNSIAPGKARSTAVAETLLLEDGEPRVALGSPGAARITAGLVQAIVNMTGYGMTAAEAVVQPRFDAYGPGTLLLESRFPPAVARELEAKGWNVVRSPKPFGVVGRVYAVTTSRVPPVDSVAGVDPGSPGAAFRQRARALGTGPGAPSRSRLE